MRNLRLKWVGTWEPAARKLRILRLMWERGEVGAGQGYSVKLSLALRPALFGFRREWKSFAVTLAGVQVHYHRSYGGIYA